MSLDLSAVFTAIGKSEDSIKDMINNPKVDLKDPKVMMQLQQQVAEYQQLTGIGSAIMSDVKQTAQGIIQKI